MREMSVARLDHFYTYSDVYETVDACDQLELLLGRLRRQGLLSEQEWMQSRRDVAEIRSRLDAHLNQPS